MGRFTARASWIRSLTLAAAWVMSRTSTRRRRGISSLSGMRATPRVPGGRRGDSRAAPLTYSGRDVGRTPGAATRPATQRGETAGDSRPTRAGAGTRIWPLTRTGSDSGGVTVIGAAGLGDWGSRVQISPSRPIAPREARRPGRWTTLLGMNDTNRSHPYPEHDRATPEPP